MSHLHSTIFLFFFLLSFLILFRINLLQLRYPQIKDTGIYECQISSTPPRGYPVYLSVVGELEKQICMFTYEESQIEGENLIYIRRTINNNYRWPRSFYKYRLYHKLDMYCEKLARITIRNVLDSQ